MIVKVMCAVAALALCWGSAAAEKGGEKMELSLRSKAFEAGGMIPSRYTCDGADISPPLEWSSAPAGTQSFALISDDPDAPMGTWVHWVIFNIPMGARSLPEGISKKERLEDGSLQGVNDFKKIGYGGPCPPGGTHRYYFRLYALDTSLDLSGTRTKETLLKAMREHILAEAQLMAKYKR